MKRERLDSLSTIVQRVDANDWGKQFRQGGKWSLFIGVSAVAIVVAYAYFAFYGTALFLLSTLVFLAALALLGGAFILVGRLLNKISTFYKWVLASGFLVLILVGMHSVSAIPGVFVVALGFVVSVSLVGASIGVLARNGLKSMTLLQRFITLGGFVVSVGALTMGTFWLVSEGLVPERSVATIASMGISDPLDLPNPGTPGPYAINTLSYGSGNDRRRAEYGDEADIITPTFDVSPLLSGWSRLRKWYWGFGPESVPLNAQVWYPEGDGPFPLVVMAHGNAEMTRASDRGYAYLGELLASRGYIFVSVDENFLNGSWLADYSIIGGLSGENDARAILLLEHLKLWREWNATPGTPSSARSI